MTLEELKELKASAIEAIEFGCSNPGFRVILPGHRYGRQCRIAPGLTGDNLGHYGKTTHVWLDAHKVLNFVEAESNLEGK